MHFKLLVIFSFFSINIFAQQIYLPLGRDYLLPFDRSLNTLSSDFHTSFKPYLQSSIPAYDSLTDYSKRYASFIDSRKHNWFWRDLFRESLINIRTEDFSMDIDPLLDISMGKDLTDTAGGRLYNNTRAIQVQGNIGKKFSFYSDFYENQSVFMPYITQFVSERQVVPGMGWVKPFKENGFDYGMASGYVSFTPNRHFNFQLGHGKNFIGDGYRSLLLSDNSFNYPFFRFNTNFWKIQYTALVSSFMDIQAEHNYELGFRKKVGNFHYVNCILTKRVHLGLFEGFIWQAADSSQQLSPDNSISGMNVKVKILNKFHAYGQVVVDDINFSAFDSSNFIQQKNGFQIGLRAFDVGLKNLNVQLEYNQVRPYTYGHEILLQNYTHYNQSITHPLGANFREGLAFIQYRYKNFFVELKTTYAIYGADTNGTHWGKNIFLSDLDAEKGASSYGNTIGQGVKTTLTYKDIRVAYLINPATNLNLIAGFSNRVQTSVIETQTTNYVYFGIATNLTNRYYDF